MNTEAPRLPELYSYIGYTVFLSQSLEGLLYQAIFSFVLIPNNASLIQLMYEEEAIADWEALVDAKDETLRRRTLGQLLKVLRENKELPSELEGILKDALRQRNYLLHEFFKQKLPTLYTNQGILDAISEIKIAGGKMKHALDAFMPIVRKQQMQFGYDDEFIEEFSRRTIDAAQRAS